MDSTYRYQRLGVPITEVIASGATVVSQQVLDCQPTVDSPLKELQALWLNQPSLALAACSEAAQLPSAALPYLALQADYFPSIPELHDALETDQHIALILEDRSNWPSFTSVWPAIACDPLQQTQWLFEMTLLWQALTAWRAEVTLLNPRRLVLSPNQLLCLTQVEQTQGPTSTLPTLGQSWQRYLLADSANFEAGIVDLIQDLANGDLISVATLQEALSDLARQYRLSPASSFPVPLETAFDEPAPPIGPLAGEQPPLSDDELIQLAEAQANLTEVDDGNDALELPTMVLPMKLVAIEDAGQSHVGQQRSHNEDWFFTQTEVSKASDPYSSRLQARGLYILCDGMGGHASGEVASQLAVTTLQEYFAQHWGEELPTHQHLSEGVVQANQVIFDANQAKDSSGISRMGTTLVLMLVQDLQVAVAHVGDSRLYSYSKRLGLRQLTTDHEVGQREINRGVEPAIAYARPDAYQLTQALGPRDQENLRPGISYHDILEDTVFILCSDGLSDHDLLERHTASHIAPLLSSKVNLDQGLAQLIQLANEKNGHDNITAVLVRLKLRPDMERPAPVG
ncbi:MAG: serine/threonine phosphatase [Leptolyngbyaceae cyanobacterium SM2_5_2]|nr:serine/threonine phosphatase [Leptolyngbyaceae cyanobacterium SM2_5_2]